MLFLITQKQDKILLMTYKNEASNTNLSGMQAMPEISQWRQGMKAMKKDGIKSFETSTSLQIHLDNIADGIFTYSANKLSSKK